MIGVGLSVGLAGGAAAEPPAPNPNELLWSEQLQQAAVWVASGAVITANTANDPNEELTADRITFDPEGTLSQTTAVAAATGSTAAATHTLTTSLLRYSAAGSFDSQTYTFSVYARSEVEVSFRLAIFRSGGVLVAQISNPDDGGGIEIEVAWAKLEAGTLTAYVKREGA